MAELLFRIESMLFIGFIVGGIISYFLPQKLGCVAFIAIPITAILFVDWWLKNTPENTSSTSAIAYFFVPLWPTIGAVIGYIIIGLIKSRNKNSDE